MGLTVSTITKINPFLSQISQQIHNMDEKVAVNSVLCAKFYFTCISGPWYPIWRKSVQSSWRNV